MKPLPDLFLGALLAVAIFALGATVGFNYQPSSTEPHQRTENGAAKVKRDNFAQWLSRDATGFFTPWLVVIGAAQVGLFLWQLWLIRESLDDAKIAADAAKESADAAKDGAKANRDSADIAQLAMIASDRAYVHYAGCRWISHRRDATSPVFWRIRPIWINAGNTPPRELHIFTYFELLDAPLPQNYPFAAVERDKREEIPAMIPPKGDLFGSWRDFPGAELLAIKEGKKFLYIWGTARYRDVFPGTPMRVTKFCNHAALISGNPMLPWDDKRNRMDLGFITFGPHNCADEDCKE